MKNWKHRAIVCGIKKFVDVPARREWPGFSFAIADDAADKQVGVIERGSASMAQRVAQFAAFMN